MWNECSVSARKVLKRSELAKNSCVCFFVFQHILVKEKFPHRGCGLGSKSDCHDVLAIPLEGNGMEAFISLTTLLGLGFLLGSVVLVCWRFL